MRRVRNSNAVDQDGPKRDQSSWRRHQLLRAPVAADADQDNRKTTYSASSSTTTHSKLRVKSKENDEHDPAGNSDTILDVYNMIFGSLPATSHQRASEEDEEEKSDYSASNSDESDDDEVDDRDIDIAVDVSRSTITRGNRNDQFAANTARINHGPNSNNSSSRNKFNLRINTQLQQTGNAGTKVMNRHSHSGSDGDRDSTGTNTNRNTPTKFLDAYKRQYARGSSLGSIHDEQETEPSQHAAAGGGAGAGAGVGVGPSDSSKNFESTRPEGIRTVGTRAGSGAAAGAGAGTGHGAEDMVSHCGSVPVSRRLNLWGITACV
jgi:hypothetical protein